MEYVEHLFNRCDRKISVTVLPFCDKIFVYKISTEGRMIMNERNE